MSVLMIHGFGFGGDVWSRMQPIFEARGWRCEAPTLFQHLRVRRNPPAEINGISLNDYVRAAVDYARRLTHEEGERPAIVGHGSGALIALKLAEQGLAASAVLLSPMGLADCGGGANRLGRAFLPSLLGLAMRRKPQAVRPCNSGFGLAFANSLPRSDRRAAREMMRCESGLAFTELLQPAYALDGATSVDESRIGAPTLTIAAGRDRIVSQSQVDQVANKLERAGIRGDRRLLPVNGALAPLEPNAARIAADLADWIVANRLPALAKSA